MRQCGGVEGERLFRELWYGIGRGIRRMITNAITKEEVLVPWAIVILISGVLDIRQGPVVVLLFRPMRLCLPGWKPVGIIDTCLRFVRYLPCSPTWMEISIIMQYLSLKCEIMGVLSYKNNISSFKNTHVLVHHVFMTLAFNTMQSWPNKDSLHHISNLCLSIPSLWCFPVMQEFLRKSIRGYIWFTSWNLYREVSPSPSRFLGDAATLWGKFLGRPTEFNVDKISGDRT